jgi:hypothetical protein
MSLILITVDDTGKARLLGLRDYARPHNQDHDKLWSKKD